MKHIKEPRFDEVKEIVPESFWEEKGWDRYEKPAILRREGGLEKLRRIQDEMERRSLPQRMTFEMALFSGVWS